MTSVYLAEDAKVLCDDELVEKDDDELMEKDGELRVI